MTMADHFLDLDYWHGNIPHQNCHCKFFWIVHIGPTGMISEADSARSIENKLA
jgi:hypothetical protein